MAGLQPQGDADSARSLSSLLPLLPWVTKVVQLVLSIFCIGLLVDPYNHGQVSNLNRIVVVYVAYCSYIIINSILIISRLVHDVVPKRTIISCICIALHAHSVFEKYSESILLPIVYGGYVIILAGLILGYVTKDRAPKKIDLLYTAAAVPLFVAAGAVGVHFYHNTGYRFHFGNVVINTGLACGSLGIINAGFFLLDAVLGVMDNADMSPRV